MPRLGSQLSRIVLKLGFGGDSLLDRIRAVSFAMLGVTAAVALALVAFVANQGWPEVGALLPAPTVHRQAIGDSSIVATPALGQGRDRALTGASAASAPPRRARPGDAGGDRHGSRRAATGRAPGANVVVEAPSGPRSTPSVPEPAPPATPQPVATPAPAPAATPAPASSTPVSSPTPTPTSPATPPVSTPTTTTPTTTSPTGSDAPSGSDDENGNGDGDGHGYGHRDAPSWSSEDSRGASWSPGGGRHSAPSPGRGWSPPSPTTTTPAPSTPSPATTAPVPTTPSEAGASSPSSGWGSSDRDRGHGYGHYK